MVLYAKDITEILKQRPNENLVRLAMHNEERLRFHCVTMNDARLVPNALNRYKDYIKAILQSEEKYKLFLTFLRFPIATNSLVESVFTELNKVFYGQNFVRTITLSNPEDKADWDWYSHEYINLHEMFEEKAIEAMATMINSIIVVDAPREQKSDKPEPYFYFLNISNVICFEVKPNTDVFEYLVFKTSDGNIAMIDDNYYRLFKPNHEGNLSDLTLIVENEHGLSYVPAAFFWRDYMFTDGKCIKRSPITKDLDKLDYLLFKIISQRIAELGSEYPITYSYEDDTECDYHDGDMQCKDGYLVDNNGQYVHNTEGGVLECPICSKKGFRGAGTHIYVPMPDVGQPDISKPIGIMVTPTDTLDHIAKSIDNIYKEIFNDIVGKDGYFSENSMSDIQIHSNFENRKTVLCRLKVNFEEAERFIISTLCRLRYGNEAFIGCTIDYGTEFYLYNVEELRERYKKAKDAGASESELAYIDNQIMCTELRNDPEQLHRMQLLRHLEPYRNLTIEELTTMGVNNGINPELFAIKVNFPALIDRFERENCNIVKFGVALPLDKRIEIISQTLKQYIQEYGIQENPTRIGREPNDGGDQNDQ